MSPTPQLPGQVDNMTFTALDFCWFRQFNKLSSPLEMPKINNLSSSSLEQTWHFLYNIMTMSQNQNPKTSKLSYNDKKEIFSSTFQITTLSNKFSLFNNKLILPTPCQNLWFSVPPSIVNTVGEVGRSGLSSTLTVKCTRIITRANSSIRSSDVLNSLEWSNLEERRKRHLLVAMFKIFNNDCPTYLREQFHRTSEIHDYNLRGSNYDLQLPLPKTNFLKRSFSYRGAMAWNQLSNETREMRDLTSFKLAIS